MPNRASVRRVFAIVLASALAACENRLGDAPASPLNLFDGLEAAQLSGLAGMLVEGPPHSAEKTLLSVDFDDERFGDLEPFGGFDTPADAARDAVAFIATGGRPATGRAVQIRGPVDHGASLRTPPIPVSTARTYRLTYRTASNGVPRQKDAEVGGATIILYRLDAKQARRAEALLGDPASEQRFRLPRGPESFSVPKRDGTRPWVTVSDRFRIDQDASHMVISFDLSRSKDDRGPHRASGEISYDDIVLTEFSGWTPEPFQQHGTSEPHPLKTALELAHSEPIQARDLRYAIHAPAPSRLEFAIDVPEAASLAFGYGLTPAAHERARGAHLGFEVVAATAEGERVSLFRANPAADSERRSRWRDAEIELDRFAGKRITLSLITSGRTLERIGLAAFERLPEAGMVWSEPIVYSRRNPGKTIVLVVLDTVAARHTSLHGYSRPTTPFLSEMGRRGVTFRRALSPSPWTLPSFASLFTGVSPFQHRAGEAADSNPIGKRPLEPDYVTLAENLRAASWETRAWINNPYLTRMFGLEQGFSRYIDYATRSRENASEPAIEDILRYLSRTHSHDRFLFVHLMDPHAPYSPNPAFRARFSTKSPEGEIRGRKGYELFKSVVLQQIELDADEQAAYRELYDAILSYTDAQVGRIFEALDTSECSQRCMLIVTADHGEEFWEHGTYEHGHTLYDELLHVPLVVYAPGKQAGKEVVEAVSLTDVAQTVLDYAGLDVLTEASATSLLPYLDGGVAGVDGEAASGDRAFVASNLLYGAQRYAVERSGHKYIYNSRGTGKGSPRAPRPTPTHELYDLSVDPRESHNIFTDRAELGLALHEELARHLLPALAGSYVIFFDAGEGENAAQIELSGALSVEDTATWDRKVRDLLWPGSDGSEPDFSFGARSHRRKHLLEFTLKAPRALLAFQIEGESPVQADLRVTGYRVPTTRVSLGRDTDTPEGLSFEIPDAPGDRLSAGEFVERYLEAPRLEQPHLVIARIGGTSRSEIESLGGSRANDIQEQLEALGYVE